MRDAIEGMGERIRDRMLELGKTETQLGKETGIDRRQICGYVNGRFTTGMRAGRVARIAQALGCSADYLLGLSNDPKSHDGRHGGRRMDSSKSATRTTGRPWSGTPSSL